jgi:hypothetical protein
MKSSYFRAGVIIKYSILHNLNILKNFETEIYIPHQNKSK